MSKASRAYKAHLKQENRDYGYPNFSRKDSSLKGYMASRRMDEGVIRIDNKERKDNSSKKAERIRATRNAERCFNLDKKTYRRTWW